MLGEGDGTKGDKLCVKYIYWSVATYFQNFREVCK